MRYPVDPMPEGATQDQADAAERDVLLATVTSWYATDSDGVATSPETKNALTAAVRAQLLAIVASEKGLGAAATANPTGRPLQSASIGSASYTVDTTRPDVPVRLQLPEGGGLCQAAYDILQLEGLLPGVVFVHG